MKWTNHGYLVFFVILSLYISSSKSQTIDSGSGSDPSDIFYLKTTTAKATTTDAATARPAAVQSALTNETPVAATSRRTTRRPATPPQRPDGNGSMASDLFFHCGRYLQNCGSNSSCDWSTGECRCDQGFKGYNCEKSSQATSSGCNLSCQNGGTCYTEGGKSSCYCSSLYTGQLCETSRVSVKCSGLELSFTILPMAPFSGKIYIGNDNYNTSCFLTEDNGVYSGNFSKDTNVCDGYYDHEPQSGETFTKQMTLQYNPLFLDNTDLVLNLSCFHTANRTVENKVTIMVAKGPETKKANDKVSGKYSPARLEILSHPNMSSLTSAVRLGQLVNMFNYLQDDGVFKAVAVDYCVVSDPDIQKSISIIENKCPSQQAKKIFQGNAAVKSDPVGVAHTMKVFKLRESTVTLAFTCTVTMCKASNDSRCAMDTCTGNRRKRRGADRSDNDDTQKQETTTTITIASDEDVRIITTDETNASCADDPLVQTTLITLSLVTALLLLVCLVLTYCVVKYRAGGQGKGSQPVARSFSRTD